MVLAWLWIGWGESSRAAPRPETEKARREEVRRVVPLAGALESERSDRYIATLKKRCPELTQYLPQEN